MRNPDTIERLTEAVEEHAKNLSKAYARCWVLEDALKRAIDVIDGLAEQQAMYDDWYEEELAYLRKLINGELPG